MVTAAQQVENQKQFSYNSTSKTVLYKGQEYSLHEIGTEMIKTKGYKLILDIAAFKERYEREIRQSGSSSDYGVYDVSSMDEPSCDGKVVTLFAEHALKHIPYKITLTFNEKAQTLVPYYSLLPLKDE